MLSLFEKKYPFTLSRLIYPIIVIFVLVALYFIVTTSYFSRYLADDFCIAVVQKKYGFWGAQKFWWKTWSGRFSYNFFLQVTASLGAWVVKILPILIYLGLTLSILPVFLLIFKPDKYTIFKGVLLSNFLIIVILINAPNIVQSLYWQAGSLDYSMPFVFFNLFLSTLFIQTSRKPWTLSPRMNGSSEQALRTFVRKPRVFNPRLLISAKKLERPRSLQLFGLLSFVFTLVGGGFVEPFAVAAMLIIVLMIIASFFIKNKKSSQIRKLLFLGLLGTITSILIMLLSPGLHIRQGTVVQAQNLAYWIESTLLGTKWYLQRILTIKTSIFSFALLFSLVFYCVSEYINKNKKKINFKPKDLVTISLLSILAGILVTTSVFGVSYYVTSYLPRERTLFIVIYFIFFSFVVFSISISTLFNILLSRKILDSISKFNLFIFFVFVILLFRSFYFHWEIIKHRMEDYARAWDFQERLLYKQKENGENVVIQYLKPVGDIDGFVENKGWVSSCAADYYGVDKINIKN